MKKTKFVNSKFTFKDSKMIKVIKKDFPDMPNDYKNHFDSTDTDIPEMNSLLGESQNPNDNLYSIDEEQEKTFAYSFEIKFGVYL